MKKLFVAVACLTLSVFSPQPLPAQQVAVTWDSRSLMLDGHRVLPVMARYITVGYRPMSGPPRCAR